jgi:tetratricopeptide (TPR) repeat protein
LLIHESGHALAARALGMPVWAIELGGGPVIGTIKLGGVPVLFRRYLLAGGYVIATCADTRYQRLRYGLQALAGPVANLAAALALIALPGAPGSGSPFPHGTHLYPLQIFVFANLLIGGLNLIPRMVTTTHGRMASDGLRLVRALLGRLNFEGMLGAHQMRVAIARLEAHDYAGARAAALEGLAKSQEANLQRAVLLNLVAWADVMLADPESFPQAMAYAKEADGIAPDNAAIQGTLGTLLVETGDYQKGLELLRKSNEGITRDQDRAMNLCHVAIAHAGLGEVDKANETLREIEALDADCALLDRARAACLAYAGGAVPAGNSATI